MTLLLTKSNHILLLNILGFSRHRAVCYYKHVVDLYQAKLSEHTLQTRTMSSLTAHQDKGNGLHNGVISGSLSIQAAVSCLLPHSKGTSMISTPVTLRLDVHMKKGCRRVTSISRSDLPLSCR